MNATLQAIWDKVQTYIRAKISPSPDPTKILAEHTAELFEETLTEVDAIKTDLSNVARLDGYNEFTGVLGLIYEAADVDARFFVYVNGEAVERLTMNKEGKFQLSDGTTADPLATWFRQSAGRMATDGKFNAVDGLQEGGVDLSAKYAPIGGGGALLVDSYSASHTLVLTNAGKLVELASASACTLTIPPDSTVAFPVGTQIPVDWGDATGQPTIVAGSGVTVQSEGNKYKITAKFNGAILHKIAANTWRIKGALSA